MVSVARSVEGRVPVAVREFQEILVEVQKPRQLVEMFMLSSPQESETFRRISKVVKKVGVHDAVQTVISK